jgi:hypothetical protein
MYLSERSLVIFSRTQPVFVCKKVLHLVHLMRLRVWENGDAAVGLLGGGNSVVQVSASL